MIIQFLKIEKDYSFFQDLITENYNFKFIIKVKGEF